MFIFRSEVKRVAFYIVAILIAFYCINLITVYTYSKQFYNTKADVALVLGAGSHNGELSPVFKERVNHAINLFKTDSVKYILLTGGFGQGETISDSKAAKNYCINNGVRAEHVLIEEKSEYTYYNIVFAKQIMDSLNLKTALLVSDPYHMKRSIGMCKMHQISVLPSPTPSTMFKTKKSKRKFLFKEAFFYTVFLIYKPFRN